jgi:hypothetical protein
MSYLEYNGQMVTSNGSYLTAVEHNYLSGFTNFGLDTLVSSGIDITSCIDAGGALEYVLSNYQYVDETQKFVFKFYWTVNSIIAPGLYLRTNVSTAGSNIKTVGYTSPGEYEVVFHPGFLANWGVGFTNYSGGAQIIDFSATNCRLYIRDDI